MTKAEVILLVEDNRDDAELTVRALQRACILNEVMVIGDGAAALAYLRRCAGEGEGAPALPVALLLDLNLPTLDGFELLRQVRADERLRRLPVVILTTSREQEDVFKCYELYADSFVPKPPEAGPLHEALQEAGVHWRLVSAPPMAKPVSVKPDDF